MGYSRIHYHWHMLKSYLDGIFQNPLSLACVGVLSGWDIPESIIIGMCWDTTASNTGHKEGSVKNDACILMACLPSPRRELHVKHADIAGRSLNMSASDDLHA